jgi:uncharacterized protein
MNIYKIIIVNQHSLFLVHLSVMEHLWLFILLAVIAEIIGTLGGFGSSLLFVPIASLFLDFHSVLGVTALFHVSSNISKITLFKNAFDKKLALTIGIPSVLFVTAGAFLTRYLNTDLLETILAFFLIAISAVLFLARKIAVKPNTLNAIVGGSLSGFAAGLLGTGGAIRGLTMAAFNLPKELFIITSAVIDLAIDLSRSFVYLSNGYIHQHDLYLVLILIAVGFAGSWTGKKILNYVSEKQFRSFALLLIFVIGVFTLYRQLT